MAPKESAISMILQLLWCCYLDKLHYIKLFLHMLHVLFLWYRCTALQKVENANIVQIPTQTHLASQAGCKSCAEQIPGPFLHRPGKSIQASAPLACIAQEWSRPLSLYHPPETWAGSRGRQTTALEVPPMEVRGCSWIPIGSGQQHSSAFPRGQGAGCTVSLH